MSKKSYYEIPNFSTEEVTELFNALCKDALGKDPAAVKQGLLGMKNAKKETQVTLSHLLLLIDRNKLEMDFRVHFLEEEKKAPVESITEPNAGVKVDPIHESMAEQKSAVGSVDPGPNPVTANPAVFNPDDIPDFKTN